MRDPDLRAFQASVHNRIQAITPSQHSVNQFGCKGSVVLPEVGPIQSIRQSAFRVLSQPDLFEDIQRNLTRNGSSLLGRYCRFGVNIFRSLGHARIVFKAVRAFFALGAVSTDLVPCFNNLSLFVNLGMKS